MKPNRFLLILLITFSGHANAQDDCQTVNAVFSKSAPQDIQIEICSCAIENATENKVTVKAKVKGKIAKIDSFEVDLPSFVLSYSNKIDINSDGKMDLGVADGSGKAGDGMHYWLILDKEPYLSALGGFPELQASARYKSTFFAVIPGSGNATATKIDYKYNGSALVPISGYSYETLENGSYKVHRISYVNGVAEVSQKDATEVWDENRLQYCISGNQC